MNTDSYQSTREKLIRAREGDAMAREEVVKENLALVKFIVKRFAGRGVEYEDLFQYGCMGLIKAVDRFDPGYTVKFSTYAVPVIMGEIRRFLRDDGPIHISRTIHERARRVDEFVQQFQLDSQRAPSLDEIANALDMEREDVLMAMNCKNRVRSLNESIGAGSDVRVMDIIGRDTMATVDRRLTLSKLLRDLPPEDRMLIVRRYFQLHTQAQIARDMGVSQVQVSRMESRILKRMRDMAGTDKA